MILALKTYGLMALGILTAALGIFFAGRKAGGDSVKLKVTEKAREVEHKATKAIIEGQKREKEIRDAPVDATKRDHFH
jgi:hypothetical protein